MGILIDFWRNGNEACARSFTIASSEILSVLGLVLPRRYSLVDALSQIPRGYDAARVDKVASVNDGQYSRMLTQEAVVAALRSAANSDATHSCVYRKYAQRSGFQKPCASCRRH